MDAVDQLLAKVILYKVGHHGSHNATLKERGLELMTNPKLSAMIPVDVMVAHDKKHWMQMPFTPLLKALGDRTSLRMVQLDAAQIGPPFTPGPQSDVLLRQIYIEW